jgi:hypothetical protein
MTPLIDVGYSSSWVNQAEAGRFFAWRNSHHYPLYSYRTVGVPQADLKVEAKKKNAWPFQKSNPGHKAPQPVSLLSDLSRIMFIYVIKIVFLSDIKIEETS